MRSRLPGLLVIALGLAALAGAQSATVAAPDLQALARRVDEHYRRLHSLEAKFVETYRGAGIERSEAGVLWLKRPGKMRWEYRQPREKLFVSDGHSIYFYVAGEAQASRTRVKDSNDLRTPLRYLLGKGRLEKELVDLRAVPSGASAPGDVTLRGVPRNLPGVRAVELEINSQNQIVRLLMEQSDGASTSFVFHDLVEDPPAADSLFHFSPPPGVRVIANDELAQ